MPPPNPLDWLGPQAKAQIVQMGIAQGTRVFGHVVRDLGESILGTANVRDEHPEPQVIDPVQSPYRAMMAPLAEAIAAAQNYTDCATEHAGHRRRSGDRCADFQLQYREDLLASVARAIAVGTTPDTVQDPTGNELLEHLNRLVVSDDLSVDAAAATVMRTHRRLRKLAERDEVGRAHDFLGGDR